MTVRSTLNASEEQQPQWWKDEPFRKFARAAIQKCAIARESFGRLLGFGVKEPELLEFLVGRAVWVFRAQKSKPWYSGSRKTYRLCNFRQRLHTMADEIEQLNKSLDASGLFCGQINVPAQVTRGFSGIPELLRRYACFVDTASLLKNSFDRRVALDKLIEFVREETGEPRFSHLSNVLIAVAYDAGVKDETARFGPDALKARDSRTRKHLPAKK
jgi:hypothetical protein